MANRTPSEWLDVLNPISPRYAEQIRNHLSFLKKDIVEDIIENSTRGGSFVIYSPSSIINLAFHWGSCKKRSTSFWVILHRELLDNERDFSPINSIYLRESENLQTRTITL